MLKTNKIARATLGLAAATLWGMSTVSGQGLIPRETSRTETPKEYSSPSGDIERKQTSALFQDTIKQASPVPEALKTAEAKPGSIKSFLKQGKFRGHIRNYFMYTDNTGDFPDYHALALGAGLYYESPQFHGFQVGLGGFFVFNAFSSDLGTDPETGLNSRYEIGLFDLLDPADKHDLGRMESLYLRYNYKKSTATLGRQKVNTPFLNPQDGRMRPSLVDALWLEVNELEKLRFQAGWVYGVGPRSTQDFFRLEESIGSIPVGRSAFGGPSQFRDNISSKGLAVGHVLYEPGKALKTGLWHYYAQNLFNFTFSQTDVTLPVSQDKKQSMVLGLQAGHQKATGDGGNEDPLKAYIAPGAETWLYSGRVGYKTPLFATSLNYTHISEEGRFLFPREWGIETFYTFMPRERLEGTAGSTAIALITDINLHKQWKARIGYGHTDNPDVKDVARNKYAMPSYSQLQLMTNYSFKGTLEGLALQALYIRKGERGNTYDTPNFIVNKVDMSHFTFVMNYNF